MQPCISLLLQNFICTENIYTDMAVAFIINTDDTCWEPGSERERGSGRAVGSVQTPSHKHVPATVLSYVPGAPGASTQGLPFRVAVGGIMTNKCWGWGFSTTSLLL